MALSPERFEIVENKKETRKDVAGDGGTLENFQMVLVALEQSSTRFSTEKFLLIKSYRTLLSC